MKKFCMLCVLLLLLLSSCGLFDTREYTCDVAEVQSVQIVRLDHLEPVHVYEYTVLHDITDYTTFIDRLNELDNSTCLGAPYVMRVGDVVIRIEFRNGDWEFVSWGTQAYCRSGKLGDGPFIFDEDEFYALIEEYSK